MPRRIYRRDNSKKWVAVVECTDCMLQIQQSVDSKKEAEEICCPECGKRGLKVHDMGQVPISLSSVFEGLM